MQTAEYLKESARTAQSGVLYPENVSPANLKNALYAFVEFGESLDVIKKALVYDHGTVLYSRKKNLKTPVDLTSGKEDIIHGIIGVATEASEIAEILLTHLRTEGETLDTVNLKEELGDVMWYIAMILRSLDTSFEEIMEMNIRKLYARFPEKFDTHYAVNRDLPKERATLEGS